MTRCDAFNELQTKLEAVHLALLLDDDSTAERIMLANRLRLELNDAIYAYRDACVGELAKEIRYALPVG